MAINGVRHICKCRSHANGVWVCFNEFLSARIATRLELPVPGFRLVEFRGSLPATETWFCSQEVHPGTNLDSTNYNSIRNQSAASGIVLFDLWLCNTDRKNEHLLVDKSSQAEKLYMIDHGHTLLTNGDFPTLRSADFEKGSRFLSGSADLCKGVSNVNEFGSALEAINAIDEGELESWIASSPGAWIPDQGKLAELKQFLIERRAKLRSILELTAIIFPNLQKGGP